MLIEPEECFLFPFSAEILLLMLDYSSAVNFRMKSLDNERNSSWNLEKKVTY
jgi:hypothetical protein